VFLTVGNLSWQRLLHHEGAWDPVQAAAVSMWAAHSLLSLLGIFQPLKMLPLVLFEIAYKAIWLVVVAWPLWSAHRLAASPAEALTHAFVPVVVPIVFVPWPFVWRNYVWSRP